MASGGALTLREMDYDPERALWVPRWGRRGFLSLGLGALAALALPSVPVSVFRLSPENRLAVMIGDFITFGKNPAMYRVAGVAPGVITYASSSGPAFTGQLLFAPDSVVRVV